MEPLQNRALDQRVLGRRRLGKECETVTEEWLKWHPPKQGKRSERTGNLKNQVRLFEA